MYKRQDITRQESGERSMTAQDKELFSQLYDRNYKRLLYAAIRIAHNPFTAEELTNEAFTILLTHFDRVRQHPNLPGWLHTVLTNLALDEYKRLSLIHILTLSYKKPTSRTCSPEKSG